MMEITEEITMLQIIKLNLEMQRDTQSKSWNTENNETLMNPQQYFRWSVKQARLQLTLNQNVL